MGFYDSVKDDVREEHRDDDEEETVAFDQLKKDAEEAAAEAEEEAEITVEENKNKDEPVELEDPAQTDSPSPPPEPEPQQEEGDAVVDVLRRIEEQNNDILTVLRGIKRGLERTHQENV